ncbi:hypothetical protein [Planktothrix tepida]|uniref:hypothetical protein n=1 Tax=Planktothrix tepida TaxID=1678309 RepID=UPI0011153023|nr:hypothetical protein [Planktothrix tepida]
MKQQAEVLSQINHPGIPKVDLDGYFTYLPKGSEEALYCLVSEVLSLFPVPCSLLSRNFGYKSNRITIEF